MDGQRPGVDLSGLHRELDRLKTQLCTCGHAGDCIACKGFEVLREQSQTVAAAASQPVLVQVAQEASIKDLMTRLGGVQGKLAEDAELAHLMGEVMQRVQDTLGGPEEMQKMFGMLGLSPETGAPSDTAHPDDEPNKSGG